MSAEQLIGQTLEGRYNIVKFLGEGGFARVYQAHDTVIGRDVAIKFLQVSHMALNDEQVAQNIIGRFEREARLAANLSHPNVVNIFDIGRIDEDTYQPFIVMEMLSGMDMEVYQKQYGAVAPTQLWHWLLPALDALGQAHEMGVVHKDLKPSNLFLNGMGQRHEALKIVDFGIAHIRNPIQDDEHGRMTQTGQILGTPQYLPPEYINHQHVSAAMDVYQMTLILIELLTGDPVVESSNSLQCLLLHGDGRLEIPSYLLDCPLGPIIRKGLALDHTQRYHNADELANALKAIDPNDIPAMPPKSGTHPLPRRSLSQQLDQPTPPPSPRHPMLIPLVLFSTILALACVTLLIVLLVVVDNKDPEPNKPIALKQAPKTPTKQPIVPTPAIKPVKEPAPSVTKVVQTKPKPTTIHKTKPKPIAKPKPISAPVVVKSPSVTKTAQTKPPSDNDLISDAIGDAVNKLEPKKATSTSIIPKAGPLNQSQALALQKRAARKLSQRDKVGAFNDCKRAAFYGARGCYNIIMRSSWDLSEKFTPREQRACKLLATLSEKYPSDRTSINIQRSFMKCAKHGM